MNEKEAKQAVKKLQRQIDRLKDYGSNPGGKPGVFLITEADAKALIELWNAYQMYKPNDFDHARNARR